jgi:hypothetical protein
MHRQMHLVDQMYRLPATDTHKKKKEKKDFHCAFRYE